MKNAVVKLGFCLLFFCAAKTSYAVGPTVSVTPVTTSPTNSTTVNFTVTFERSVNGFDKNDITLGGAAATGLTVGANVTVTPASPSAIYNVQVTGLTTSGPLIVTIAAGVATDAASPFEASLASDLPDAQIDFDNVKPRPLITQPGQADPTTGGSTQIKFTVTWTEPISSFPSSAISFAGSGTGGGTLSVNSITEIAPMNKTKYEVFVDVDAPNATGAQHVIMTIPADGVTDLAGNLNLVDNPTGRDNDVVYAGTFPTIASPPTAVPTEDGFIISGNVTFDGGLSSAQRGFVWKNSSPVAIGDHKTQVGTGEGSFTGGAVTGQNDETQFFYRTWVDNGIGSPVLSTEQSIYTLSQAPANNDNVTATAKGTGQIDLSFSKFQTNTRADGMIILRKQGSAPTDNDLKDAQAPLVSNMPLLIAVITDNQQTTYSDTDPSLLPGTKYYYAVVPFSWDQGNSNIATYNYKEGFSTDNDITFSKSSIIAYTGSPTAIDYDDYLTTDFSSSSDGVSIASFTLHDGDNITDDADGLYTELKSLTITVSNPSMIRRIAIADGTTMHGEQNMDPSGTVTFNIAAGNILTKDNNATGSGSPDQFDIIASFDPAQVSDGAPITVTITGATVWTLGATPSGSDFAASNAGGASNGTDYTINVIASTFDIPNATITSPINPNSAWGFTATLKDSHGNIDTNIGGTVTVTESSLNPPVTPVGNVTKPVVNGVVVFTGLIFDDAGNKAVNLDASNWAGANNGTLNVSCLSTGVTINFGPSNLAQTFCFNNSTPASVGTGGAADPTFVTLNDIVIQESDKADFAVGNSQTYSFILPPGFIFNTMVTAATPMPNRVVVSSTGTDISTTAVFVGYTGNNIARIQYTTTGTTSANKDKITISGLKVKYTSTTPVTNLDITRVGGTAVQVNNSDSDGKSHGQLSSDNGATAVDFVVTTAGFNASETHFSKTGTGLISLQGKKASDASNINGVFSGTGVALDQDGVYKFNPSQLAPGIYDITFTYTDPAATACMSTITKQFEVYTTIINGLNSIYCVYDPKSTLLGPTNYTTGGYYFTSLGGIPPILILNFDPNYFADFGKDGSNNPIDPYVWFNPNMFGPGFGGYQTIPPTLPAVYEFLPGDPTYAAALAANGNFLEVGYRKYNNHTAAYDYVTQRIIINQRPFIEFTPDFANGICSTDANVDLKSPQLDAAGTFDEFWSSSPGFPGTAVDGISGDRTTGFVFEPALANPAPATNTALIQINYKHRDPSTGCTNQIAQTVSVWRKPPQVPTSVIQINNSTTGDTSGEFCQGDPITAFSIVPVNSAMFYRWYDAGMNTEVAPPGKTSFVASSVNIPTTGGLYDVGVYTFNITQTENRVLETSTSPGFNGCESNPRPITVEIFAPTLINAGTPTTICEGNDLILSTLNASITPPSGTLDGVWSSTSASPGTFSPNSIFKTAPATGGALTYTPSPQEIALGSFTLRLTSNDPTGPCGVVTSTVIVRINPGTTVTFPISPVLYCASKADMTVEGKVSTANLGFHWSVTSGGGSLDPGSEVLTTTKYLPSSTVLNDGGDVVLTLTTDDPDGSGPCVVVSNSVHILVGQRPIVVAGPDLEICADQTINVTSRIPPNGNAQNDFTKSSATSVTWTHDGLGNLVDPTQLATTYNPDPTEQAVSAIIKFTATSNTPGGTNVCPAETDDIVITLRPRPGPPTPITPPNYCVNDVIGLLTVVGTYPSWYSDPALGDTHRISAGNPQQSTSLDADQEMRVPFWVTQTTDRSDKPNGFPGCESTAVKMVVVVNPLPVPAFTFANQCLGDIMQFTNGSTIAQPIDPLEPARSISGYQWNFADNLGSTTFGTGTIPATDTQGGATSGTYENPGHKFKAPGEFAVKLALVTSDGCTAEMTHAAIDVGPIPVADFSVAKLCDDDDTKFISYTGLDTAVHTTYGWDFDDAASGTSNSSGSANPTHNFSSVGSYDVTLTVTTNLNCSDVVTKKTSIYPYVKSFPYVENFESPNHGWVAEGKVINGSSTIDETSWNLLTSAGSIASDPDNAAGSKFWATHTNVSDTTFYYNNERSLLYGPCVDMTDLKRPVLAVDYFNDTESKGDGVYIEYIDENDPKSVWTRLGDNVRGLNWYNESSIGGLSQSGGIGQTVSQFGWSGSTTNWTTGRYSLDELTGKTRVRFRVVFGANSNEVNTDVYDGFALDYFRLESRNRLVLVENFTSKSQSPLFTTNRDAYKAFPSVSASSEVVKIEYHTGLHILPGDAADPIFGQNPMDPNARASFYGLSAVPRGYIDGYSNLAGSGMFNGVWAANYYSTESLKTSPLTIAFNTTTITNGALHVTGTITATDFDLLANKYSLYVAIVEETVGTDAYVLRKMLPSASGKKVPFTAKGGTFTFDETWNIDRSYLGADPQLVAVAFVQSDVINTDNERSVLQAAYKLMPPVDNFTTGVEVPFLEQTAIFPNPADHLVNIELPQPTTTGVDVKIIDQLGRPVIQSQIAIGQRSVSVDTGNLSSTMYIVQLNENGVYTTRKLVVTHKH